MASPERPRTGNRFSDSPETPPKRPRTSYQRSTSFKTGSTNHPIASASTNHYHDVIRMTARYERSGRRDANHIGTMSPETRQGRSYRPLCAALCPRLNVHTALCCLTLTTSRTTQHGELSSDPCSLGISVQGQSLHPRLNNLPQGLDNLGVHTCRAPPTMAQPRHQLSLGTSCGQRTTTGTSLVRPYIKLLCRTGSDVTGALLRPGAEPLHRLFRHSNRLQVSDRPPLFTRRHVTSACITPIPPSIIKGRDRGCF